MSGAATALAGRFDHADTAREAATVDELVGKVRRIQAALSGPFTTDAGKQLAKRYAREAAQLAADLAVLL